MVPPPPAKEASVREQETVWVCVYYVPGMHLNDKPVCQSPLLRTPLQVERHQARLCRLYISIHN